jgi:hypothetical protein
MVERGNSRRAKKDLSAQNFLRRVLKKNRVQRSHLLAEVVCNGKPQTYTKDRPGSLPLGEFQDTLHKGALGNKGLKWATTEMGTGSTKTGQVRKGGIIR